MCSRSRLKAAVTSLREARSQMRNAEDARVIENLDNAIRVLEAELEQPGNSVRSRKKALAYLGEAAKYLPAIEKLLNRFME